MTSLVSVRACVYNAVKGSGGLVWNMTFQDISAQFKKLREQSQQTAIPEQQYDHAEALRLRSRMLGVLIRDARIEAARSVEECARLLHTTTEAVLAWEYGEEPPSLPELELMAYYFDVPVTHFFGDEASETERAKPPHIQLEYVALRQRMVGAMLRQARLEAGRELEVVASATGITPETLDAYELGQERIPLGTLAVLAPQVNRNLTHFLDGSGQIGEMLRARQEWYTYLDLDPEIRAFVSNPSNIGFLQIAMMYSKMPAKQLREIAEGILEITM
jgi:transcriptional regulator with XRE-family HTH domain